MKEYRINMPEKNFQKINLNVEFAEKNVRWLLSLWNTVYKTCIIMLKKTIIVRPYLKVSWTYIFLKKIYKSTGTDFLE